MALGKPLARYHPEMATSRGLVLHPHPVLRMKARPVERIDAFVKELVKDLFRYAKEHEGIGIAAPQLGESLRVFVVLAHDGEPERAFINPRLVLSRPSNLYDEGCLSLPDIRGEIMRPPHAVITATDIDGNEFTLESDGLFARVWQHEYDHLDGILIIDRMRPIDRLVNRRAIRDLERAAPRAGH